MSRALFLAALFRVATSISSGPAPTERRVLHHDELAMWGISPAPTPPPRRRHPTKLFERQGDEVRESNTCAYFDEDYYDPLTCGSGFTCSYDTGAAWFGCCSNPRACSSIQYTSCVPSSRVSSRQVSRSGVRYCTEGTSTECATFKNVWEAEGIAFTMFGCVDEYLSGSVYYEATNGPVGGTSETPTPSSGTNFTPTPSPDKSSTPIGAIVGGVIGGIAALAIIGFGAFLIIRRKKKAPTPPVQYSQPEHMADPKSPSPPYQPPYSPPPQTLYNPSAPNVSQMP